MSSAICVNLDQFKTLSSGNGLKDSTYSNNEKLAQKRTPRSLCTIIRFCPWPYFSESKNRFVKKRF